MSSRYCSRMYMHYTVVAATVVAETFASGKNNFFFHAPPSEDKAYSESAVGVKIVLIGNVFNENVKQNMNAFTVLLHTSS